MRKPYRDASRGRFIFVLRYKAEEAGISVVRADLAHTSQECSGCGAMLPKDLVHRLAFRIAIWMSTAIRALHATPPPWTWKVFSHGVDGWREWEPAITMRGPRVPHSRGMPYRLHDQSFGSRMLLEGRPAVVHPRFCAYEDNHINLQSDVCCTGFQSAPVQSQRRITEIWMGPLIRPVRSYRNRISSGNHSLSHYPPEDCIIRYHRVV